MSNLSLYTNFQLELRCKHHDVSTNIKGYLCTNRNKIRWIDYFAKLWPRQSLVTMVSSWRLQITPDVGEVTASARTLETFPRTLVPNWNFHNLSRTLDTRDHAQREEICLQNQRQAAKAPSYSPLIPLCSSIRNKTNKQMAGRALSGVPRLIWNILGKCLDSDFDSENAGNGIEHFWARGCWLPNRSLTNILYFLFWARAAAGVMRCEGESH